MTALHVYNFKLTLCSNLVRGMISSNACGRHVGLQSRVLFWAKAAFVAQLTSWVKYGNFELLPSRDAPDYTKYASLVDKPQNEFSSYFCEAKRIILLPARSFDVDAETDSYQQTCCWKSSRCNQLQTQLESFFRDNVPCEDDVTV